MNAYVVTADPVHENSANYFIAELGFYRLGYYVERYRFPDLASKEISEDTPVFGGIESILTVLPNYCGLPYYPGELEKYMLRKVELRPIEEVRVGEFFKPVEEQHKLFSPRIKDDSFECELSLAKIPKNTEVIASDAINFVSEFRVYVCSGEILNVCFYKGDPLVRPDSEIISSMVRSCSHYATAFGLDVGVTQEGATSLVEMNDFCCLGNYGLRAASYARSIATRWEELWNKFAAAK